MIARRCWTKICMMLSEEGVCIVIVVNPGCYLSRYTINFDPPH